MDRLARLLAHQFREQVAARGRYVVALDGPGCCGKSTLAEAITIAPRPLTIVEGIGALHPSLAPFVHYGIWLDGAASTRMARVAARDGHAEVPTWASYVRYEQAYLERCRPWRGADLWVFGAELPTSHGAHSFSTLIERFGHAVTPAY